MSGGVVEAPETGKQGAAPSVLVLPALILLIGCLVQARVYINQDAAWVLYGSRLMLHGATFGTDIIEPNPPLIWWISAIPAAVSELLNAPPIATLRVFVALIAAGSLVAIDRLLACNTSPPRRIVFLAVAAYLFTIATHRDFGQREHFTVMLILPYVLAVGLRMEGRSLGKPAGIAIGIAAGLGLAFKPHFGLVPLFLEAALLWKARSPRLLLRPEAIGGIGVVALVATAILLLARPWLFEVIPDVGKIYWAFNSPFAAQWEALASKFAVPFLAAALIMCTRPPEHVKALFIAAAGFAGAAILQGKYYTYHLYAIYAFLILGVIAGFWNSHDRRTRFISLIVFVMFPVILLQNLNESVLRLYNLSERGGFGRRVGAVIEFVVENTAKDGSFLAVSTHNFPAFPTALYADRRHASRTNSQFYLPAVVKLRAAGAAADPDLLAFAERKARAAILHDLALAPDVVLIDRNRVRHAIGTAKFDFLEFYLEDPEFRAVWSNYKQVEAPPRGFAKYLRVRS